MKLRDNNTFTSRGFTMFELLVILSIFGVITTILVFNYRGFRESVSLTNLAHNIALTIRQAKVFAGSATEFVESPRRGVRFSYDSGSGGYDRSFIIYADDAGINQNVYDTGDTIVDTIRIATSDYIKEICVGTLTNPGGTLCTSTHNLDIIFTRAEPNATITLNGIQYQSAVITISQANDEATKDIVIRGTGQISIE